MYFFLIHGYITGVIYFCTKYNCNIFYSKNFIFEIKPNNLRECPQYFLCGTYMDNLQIGTIFKFEMQGHRCSLLYTKVTFVNQIWNVKLKQIVYVNVHGFVWVVHVWLTSKFVCVCFFLNSKYKVIVFEFVYVGNIYKLIVSLLLSHLVVS